jgi:flagellar protein FliO/FliZ
MGVEGYLRFAAALAVVLAMIAAAAWAWRRFALSAGLPAAARRRRLGVVEVLPLDGRRRLVLVRRDRAEHLLLLGHTDDLVVERGIEPPKETDPP